MAIVTGAPAGGGMGGGAMKWMAAHAPGLRASLLRWWQAHGRHDLPWKLGAAGQPPGRGEVLDPYPIWVAEVMAT